MSPTRRTLGTGPRPDEPELTPVGDSRERARTAAERAAAEPIASADEDQMQTRPPGRRRLGTGPEPDQSLPD
ncbi:MULTISPECIES: hypothetical protein [Streptomyces]|uniref:hypothetical protein n=1 Tax=Streptomyces lycopersici TaxID=2974589 RepID=UPI0021D0F6E2|nr:hypothetical protein [Streptomyces sp. NEAU-383]